MPDPGTLLIEDQGPVRILRLNRARRRNALDLPMVNALHQGLVAADQDDGVRALVLGAEGPVFCAGGDMREGEERGAAILAERLDLTRAVLSLLPSMSKPVVAAVQGAALGGGAGLAIACDLVVAAEDVRFGYPSAGVTPVGLLVLGMLKDIMGGRQAFSLISQGRVIGGAEMLALGLAQIVVPAPNTLSAAIGVATRWAETDPSVLAAHKALFRVLPPGR